MFQNFKDSHLGPNAEKSTLDIPVRLILARGVSSHTFLADSAYALSSAVIKLVPSTNITEARNRFNFWLSGARVCVERAFGRFKGRWRILNRALEGKNIEIHAKTIVACCILYYLCVLDPNGFARLIALNAANNAARLQRDNTIADEQMN